MKFPVIIIDGNIKITFSGGNERSVTNPEAYDQFGNVIHSSLDDIMHRVAAGRAEVAFTADSPIMVVRIPDSGKLYRVRSGNVESSVNNGRFWMSTNASVCWFMSVMNMHGKAYAPLGEFIG